MRTLRPELDQAIDLLEDWTEVEHLGIEVIEAAMDHLVELVRDLKDLTPAERLIVDQVYSVVGLS